MADTTLTPEAISDEDLFAMKASGLTRREICERTGLSMGQVGGRIFRYRQRREQGRPEVEEPSFKEGAQGAEASATGVRIMTLSQLLRACNVDIDLWRVERYVVNKWEVFSSEEGLHDLIQVKAWLARREEAPFTQAMEALLAKVREEAPAYEALKLTSGEYLFVPSLYDAHFNKRAANGHYSLAEARRVFCGAADTLVARAQALGLKVGRVLLVAGQDMLHADNLQGTTTKGTWMETAADQRDAVEAVCESYVYAIERLATLGPVDVVTVPSNHDRYSVHWLGLYLSAWFSNHRAVTVDTGSAPRKYYRFGSTLLGLDHGDKVRADRLALTMAVEAPEDWAATTYREWLRGHLHKQMQMYYPVTEESGVAVRVLPALCPPDNWHILRGFIGNKRAAEGAFYHREYGPAGSFPVFVDELPGVLEKEG